MSIFYISLFLMLPTTLHTQQCNVILSSHFGHCTNRPSELKAYRDDELNRVYSFNTSHLNAPEKNCKNGNTCRRIFNIARIRRHSFGAKTLVQMSYMLARCCGECAKYYRKDIYIEQLYSNLSIVDSYDIVYPVLGRLSKNEIYGYHFIPVFYVPGAFYLTLGKSEREMSADMIMGCLNMWPLFIMCITLSLVAGFVAWLVEFRQNREEFPSNFFLGLYEGFWWSFVSMTTVGYGDKVPKSKMGRMFSIIWILIGITITAIFTASLTTKVMDSGATDISKEMSGKRVGILKHRLHDGIMVAQHRGIVNEIDFNNTIHGIRDLIKMLYRKELDGVLMSRSTYFFFYRMIKENDKYKNISTQIKGINLLRFEKDYKDNELVVGMLVKNIKDFNYFKKYFEVNWFQIQSCYLYSLNYKDKQFEVIPFAPLEGMFYPFFYWTIAILGVIILCGSIFEIRKYYLRISDKNEAMCHDMNDMLPSVI